jgi:hypothetical protein
VRAFYGDVSVANSGDIHASNFYWQRHRHRCAQLLRRHRSPQRRTHRRRGHRLRQRHRHQRLELLRRRHRRSTAPTATISVSTDNVYGGTATGIKARSVLGASAVANYGDIDASAIRRLRQRHRLRRAQPRRLLRHHLGGERRHISAYASTGDGVGLGLGHSRARPRRRRRQLRRRLRRSLCRDRLCVCDRQLRARLTRPAPPTAATSRPMPPSAVAGRPWPTAP